MRATPVIQRRDPDVVFGAILAPRHPALCKSFRDLQNLFLALHLAIFSGNL
jgi:hypothetical protein